ncbi:hypothetical protein PmAV1_gp1 [Periconia macrospinosa ambiguivirus 1]|nr:hypothetical protein PmAV1_gp1 [Periconia macrospinosa ambiguivirus 1]
MSSSSLVVYKTRPFSSPLVDGPSLMDILFFLDQALYFIVFWAFGVYGRTWVGVVLSGASSYEQSPFWFWVYWLPSTVYTMVWLHCWIWWVAVFLAKWAWLLVLRKTTLGWLLEVVLAFVNRGSRAPPAVLRGEAVLIGGVPAPQVLGRGQAYAQAAMVPHASVTAGGLTPTRCRRRSRWVRSLQEYLGTRPGVIGRLIRGRWVPDLPDSRRAVTANAVLALLEGDTKVLGGGLVPSSDPTVNEPFLIVQRDSGREVIVPNLLGRLCRGTFGRERDASLLAQLRSRAVEWCTSKEVTEAVVPLLVPGMVALAMCETAPERLAREFLEGRGISTTQGC